MCIHFLWMFSFLWVYKQFMFACVGWYIIICLTFENLLNSFPKLKYFTLLSLMYEVLISPHACQHLLLSGFIFIIISTLVGVKWHSTVVMICISLMASAVKHHFICLLAICIIFFGGMTISTICTILNLVICLFIIELVG